MDGGGGGLRWGRVICLFKASFLFVLAWTLCGLSLEALWVVAKFEYLEVVIDWLGVVHASWGFLFVSFFLWFGLGCGERVGEGGIARQNRI